MIGFHPSAFSYPGRKSKPLSAFAPGRWGDQLVFGYMFRVVVAVSSVIASGLLLIIVGALNGWVLTNEMVGLFGALVAIMILIGEALRVGAYESAVNKKNGIAHKDDYSSITREMLEIYGGQSVYYRVSKRAVDLAFAVPAIITIAPVIFVAALLVRFDSPGPSFYLQRRMGFRGRELYVVKLRTRAVMAEDGQTPQITRAGRFLRATSVDELPALINVVLGSMTLVGPRPLPFSQVVASRETMSEGKTDVRAELLWFAKPGITGIFVRADSNMADVLSYLKRRSLWVDLVILLSTARIIVRNQNR